jgi:hypothetical protein
MVAGSTIVFKAITVTYNKNADNNAANGFDFDQ